MKKQWAIVFVVVVLLWVGFMVYRHYKGEEEATQYVEETFSAMTKAAQESPKAGLTYMGMAIKKFKSEKNQYPESLDALYPSYINDRSFIEDVDWEYSFDKDNFRLAKTVVIDQQTYTAFVDNRLMPLDVGAERDVRTAEADRQPGAGAPTSSPTARRPSPARSQAAAARVPEPPPQERTATREELEAMKAKLLTALIEAGKQPPPPEEEEEKPAVVYTPVGDAGEVDERIAGQYLTWKNEKGVLGFGNVMYPAGEENLIYKEGKWIRVQHTDTETPREGGTTAIHPSPEEEDLARKHGGTYLAWKDKSGVMGFGNVAYPEKKDNLVYQDGQWVSPDKDKIGESGRAVDVPPSPAKPDTESVAAKYGDTYLTWKDKSGVIGFGNIMYPEREQHAVYQAGRWVTAGTETPADILENPLSFADPGREQKVRKHGKDVYVWKDKSGILGFGNMTIPEKDGISVMRSDGKWVDTTATGTGGDK